MAIHSHSNETETKWSKGGFQVMIMSPTSDKPIGYSEGTPEDEADLISQAEQEGLADVVIQKKSMKSGREIWTITGQAGF